MCYRSLQIGHSCVLITFAVLVIMRFDCHFACTTRTRNLEVRIEIEAWHVHMCVGTHELSSTGYRWKVYSSRLHQQRQYANTSAIASCLSNLKLLFEGLLVVERLHCDFNHL